MTTSSFPPANGYTTLSTQVTNLDGSGVPIRDPQAASLEGAYTSFCGYFLVRPSMSVASMGLPDMVKRGVSRWHDAGLLVSEQVLPYTPGVDNVLPDMGSMEQDAQALQRRQSAAASGRRRTLLSSRVAVTIPAALGQPQGEVQQRKRLRRALIRGSW